MVIRFQYSAQPWIANSSWLYNLQIMNFQTVKWLRKYIIFLFCIAPLWEYQMAHFKSMLKQISIFKTFLRYIFKICIFLSGVIFNWKKCYILWRPTWYSYYKTNTIMKNDAILNHFIVKYYVLSNRTRESNLMFLLHGI